MLGEGAFGKVYRGIPLQNALVPVALKEIMHLKGIDFSKIRDEISIMQHLKGCAENQYYVRLEEVWEDPGISGLPGCTTLVEELLEGGELYKRISELCENNEAFTERDASKIMRDMFSATKNLHRLGILHLDIKLENLVFADRSCSLIKLLGKRPDESQSFLSSSSCLLTHANFQTPLISFSFSHSPRLWHGDTKTSRRIVPSPT